jgi:hypothetical protein
MSKIENGFAIPLRKYPWTKMKAGESFTVKTSDERNNGLRVARGLCIKATSRKIKGGYRLWRTT